MFLGTFWYWTDPDTCSCRGSRETSQDLLHPAVKWLWRPALVRLAFSSEGLCLFGLPGSYCICVRTADLQVSGERGPGSPSSLQFLISCLRPHFMESVMPGLIWKWCCSQVCKALCRVSSLLGGYQYTQQSLLLRTGPAEAAAPHGGHTQWKPKLTDFVSVTRELVRKVCVVDLNVYINISPKALFSWVRDQNLWNLWKDAV